MKGFFKRFIFTFNIIAIIFLAGSYLSVYISPAEAWLFALLGLAYPFFLVMNIFFALFWLFQFKLKAFFSIAVIIGGISYFNQTFRFGSDEDPEENMIRVVSYNAGLFGYFQSKWYSVEMMKKTKSLGADILCVQEFLNISGDQTSTVDSVKQFCGFKFAYFQKLKDGRKRGEYGMAVFSAYPIEDAGLVQFDGLTGNMCLYSDIRIEEKLFRIYNVHLQSFKFKKQDYKFVKDMPDNNEEKIKQSKGILKRMKEAYQKRAEQVEAIVKHVEFCESEYFVLGDFNDPPVSYSYNRLSRGLKDAFVEKGKGMGKTYIGIMPNFRIDYILFPERMEGGSFKTYKLSSDHSMLCAGIKYKND